MSYIWRSSETNRGSNDFFCTRSKSLSLAFLLSTSSRLVNIIMKQQLVTLELVPGHQSIDHIELQALVNDNEQYLGPHSVSCSQVLFLISVDCLIKYENCDVLVVYWIRFPIPDIRLLLDVHVFRHVKRSFSF